jgi:hypothetical protein
MNQKQQHCDELAIMADRRRMIRGTREKEVK